MHSELREAAQCRADAIFCQADKADAGYVLRCDVMKISNKPPPRPKDFDLDWGRAFEISGTGASAQRLF
jgi:hypothetical protein